MKPGSGTGLVVATGGASTEDLNKFLSISLHGEAYGLAVLRIKEIIEYDGMTAVPMMPDFIRGAINLRGRGVPVLDLGLRFGKPRTEISRRTCVVIVEAQGEDRDVFDVGLLVDAVNEVVDIQPADIEVAPTFGGKIRTDFIQGMGKVKNEFIILLNIDRILSLEDLALLSGAAQVDGAADQGLSRGTSHE